MRKKTGVVIGTILISVAALLVIRTLNSSDQDFIPWIQQDSGTTADLYAVTWGGGQYVVVGENGKIATSPDGITWTNRFSGTPDHLKGVAWNGSLYVAAGANTIISSPDGVTWTFRAQVPTGGSLYGVAWGNGLFVAVGKRPSVAMGLTMISGYDII